MWNLIGRASTTSLKRLEKVFRPTRDILKEIDPQTDFLYMWFIYCFLTDTVLFYNWFLTSRYSKLVGYACYLVHSLSAWFTHSFISSLFKLNTDLALSWSGGELVAFLSRLFSISIHWTILYWYYYMFLLLFIVIFSSFSFKFVNCYIFRYVFMRLDSNYVFRDKTNLMMIWIDFVIGHSMEGFVLLWLFNCIFF